MSEDEQKAVHAIVASSQAFHARRKGISLPSGPSDPGVEIARRFKEACEKGMWPLSEKERQERKQSAENYAADMKETQEWYAAHLNQEYDDESDLECSSPDRGDAGLVKRQRPVAPLPDMAPKMDRSS